MAKATAASVKEWQDEQWQSPHHNSEVLRCCTDI